jgi:hypothetical protein
LLGISPHPANTLGVSAAAKTPSPNVLVNSLSVAFINILLWTGFGPAQAMLTEAGEKPL